MISIVILSYNNYQYYKQCLESVLSQTFSHIEIIISDDGSYDFPHSNILEFIKKNNKGNILNVNININEKNLGIVKNYNKALRLCNGEYVFYLCIDDILYDDKVIEDVVEYFNNTKFSILTGYRDLYNMDLNRYIKTLPRKEEVNFIKSLETDKLYEKLCMSSFISGCNTPFRRALIDKEGFLDEEYFYLEDYPRYLKLLKNNYKIGFIDRKLIKYRMGGITTNGKINDLLRRDLFLVAEKEKKEFIIKNYKLDWFSKKRIIGWGTGDCFIECNKLGLFKVDYLVDSNKEIQGTSRDNVIIKSPEILIDEVDNDETFVFVFSYSNYFDIAKELDKIGFKEKKNYYLCTPEILKVLGVS